MDGGGGRGRNERDRDERKVLGSRKHKQNVNQPSAELIEREEKRSCAEGGREVETKRRKARFIGEQVSDGKRQKGGKEVFTGEPRSKGKRDGGMNGQAEERRNNENSRQGC